MKNNREWYLAQIVQEFRLSSEKESTVYINFVLIQADSKEEAYIHALEIGEDVNFSSEGGTQSQFIGLHDLSYIHKRLNHGTIILSERKEYKSEEHVEQLVRPKERYNIFAPIPSNEDLPERPAFIPADAEWYLAEIVETTLRNNMTLLQLIILLVHAFSPQEAYEKSLVLGKYFNKNDDEGIHTFKGLRDISVIH